jgi:CBS domain containing-hemolysin-like protein
LLEEFGHVPEPGDRLEREGIAMEVLEATETQVLRVRLHRISPTAALEGGPAVPDRARGRTESEPARS